MNSLKIIKIEKSLLQKCPTSLRSENGVTLIIVAVMMVVLIGFAALAIDIGYYMVTRNELQDIADGASLAACRVLGDFYHSDSFQNLTPEEQRGYVCDDQVVARIIGAAVAVGTKNKAGGKSDISILDDDVSIGTWDGNTFTPGMIEPDAVRVIARRDANANNPIATFLAGVVGINTINVHMKATAALTGQSTTKPGELELPVGISSYFFQDGNFCNNFIVFNPTNDPDSCAGWNSYDLSPPNDSLLRDILNGDPSSPGTTAGDTEFNFIGGNLSNPTFDSLLLLFMRKGYDTEDDGITPAETDDEGNPITGALPLNTPGTVPLLEDGEQAYYPDADHTPRNLHRWETTVAVYDWDTCDNPNTSIKIVGYTKIAMTNVQTAPEKKIEGEIMCDQYSQFDTRGGGGSYGIKGTIPGLVE